VVSGGALCMGRLRRGLTLPERTSEKTQVRSGAHLLPARLPQEASEEQCRAHETKPWDHGWLGCGDGGRDVPALTVRVVRAVLPGVTQCSRSQVVPVVPGPCRIRTSGPSAV
jgi:hypothetical protein